MQNDPERNGPGILTGVLMPYGQRATDRSEMFDDGALHWPEGGVVLREMHDRKQPIMRFVPTVEGREVRVAIPLPDTQRGRDAALSVRNGTFTGLSVEFNSEQEEMRSGLRVIRRARLSGAGLVDNASYETPIEVRGEVGKRFRFWL